MNERHQSPETPDALPANLADAFRSLGAEPLEIPRAIDAAVLAAARPRLAGLRRRRAVRQRMAWAGVAAAAGLAAWFVLVPDFAQLDRNVRMDIDGNGVVDVLDAFTLARDLQTKRSLPGQKDFNRDGVINDADVQLVMSRAVDLSNRRLR